jgi:Abnormal spindle-like microcephaly-assoc'd, ASPM-SPD-2-Hydin/Protein of unknown function (DUF1573)
MNNKLSSFPFYIFLIAVICVLGGCVGYAGQVGPSAGGASKSTAAPLTAAPTTLSFGSVAIGSNSSETVSVTNGGKSALVLSSANSSNTAFIASGVTFPMNLAAGQSVALRVGFSPRLTGNLSGQITVGSSNGSTATIPVNGTGTQNQTPGAISASTASLDLGTVTVGNTATQGFTVTNTGGTAATLSGVTSSATMFATSGPTFPATINPGQTIPFTVSFAPTATGNASGVITVASDASNAPTAVAVSGSGVASTTAPTISSQPAAQNVIAGQTATFSVTATGTAPLAYQWSKNGAAISGATAASYTTPATTSADNGASFTVAVSNSGGNMTSNAAALTVSAATLSLSANPTSVSFGSVNVGSNSSQTVTFTNGGNSDVTVSNVSVSGAGFNATGISAGQVVAAGKTASLSVTFAPGTSGSLTGNVSVTSNAANSPLSIALSGTGASATSGGAGAPTCGKNNDTAIEVPSDWSTFVPPAKGQSYVDSSFGCTVTRITDVSSEDWEPACNGSGCYMPLNMGYATVSPFNADDTYLMLANGWNSHFVVDLRGNIVVPIANMPDCNNSSYCNLDNSSNDGWFYWDATDPAVFYYTSGNSMMKGTISGSKVSTTVVHQFMEYAAIDFFDKTDLSEDGAHVVITAGDTTGSSPLNIFDYDFVTNTKGPVYTTSCTGTVGNPQNSCVHGVTQTADNNIQIGFASDGTGPEQGARLWDGTTPLPHLQDFTNHLDTGYDINGTSVFVAIGNSSVLSTDVNPCPSGWGTDVRQVYDTTSATCLVDIAMYGGQFLSNEHVGYRGGASQPWVTLSFFDDRTLGPEWFDNSGTYTAPNTSNWQYLEDEIDLVRIDANNNPQYLYRLAHAYSRSDEVFYAQPHASMSRDGKYVAFQSNAAYAHTGCPANFQTTTDCTDVYVIQIH